MATQNNIVFFSINYVSNYESGLCFLKEICLKGDRIRQMLGGDFKQALDGDSCVHIFFSCLVLIPSNSRW